MTVAIYPGSFDPPTNGHLALIREAARVFDHVVVLLAIHPQKTPMFSPTERAALLRRLCAQMPQVRVAKTDGLVVEFAKEIGARVLVRGIRDGDDANAETSLAEANAALAPEISTVLLPAARKTRDVSSSRLKAMLERGESISDLCPPLVERAVLRRFSPRAPTPEFHEDTP